MRAVESRSKLFRDYSSLLKQDADPNLLNDDKNTALIMACTTCCKDVVKMLLSFNADISVNDYKALTESTNLQDTLIMTK
jgi:ankyrin repeat protein